MRYSISRYMGRSAALAVCLLPAMVFAQQQNAAANAAANAGAAPAGQLTAAEANDEAKPTVIITGVTRTTTKKNATFSINTLSGEDIQRLAPMSTADLLSNFPGIYAEGSTAGEASNNITVRGLPVVGGFRFAPQLIDGLPAYEEPEAPLMNNDVFVRDDLMTEAVEVVKGGTGGILYSNGLGATVNHISRTGGDQLEGGYKIEYADYGFIRQDAFVSGPLGANLKGAVGGFYRTSKGIRDTGYTADKGGQIRGNLVYTSDDRTLTARVDGLLINDRTAFYQNLPISVPRLTQSGTPSNPTIIDQDTIQPIGIPFAHGTTASPNNRRFNMIGEYGTRTIDQADGIHPNFKMLTLKVSKDLDSGWKLSSGLRHTGGSNGFNAVFTGNDTTSASTFLNARFQNDVVSPAHSAALGCNLASAKLVGFFNVPSSGACAAFANISREDFVKRYAKASGVVGHWLNDGSQVAGNANLNFLIPFVARVEAASTSLDLKAQKTFNLLGTHDATFGLYGSHYTFDPNFQASLMVGESAENSRLAELTVVDASGARVGPSLTTGSAILPGWFGFNSNVKADGRAAYVMDHWETLDNKLKMDFGVRWQDVRANVDRRDRDTATDLTPASVVPGSLQDTTADNEILFPGASHKLNRTFSAVGWSVGANYSISKPLAVYGLVSRSFRLPSLEDLNNLATANPPVVDGKRVDIDAIERIKQYEGGLRYLTRGFGAAVAVFYNNFSPRGAVNVHKDIESPRCSSLGGVTQINSCPDVAQLYKRGVKNVGAEVELSWRPREVEGLELKGSFVTQNPKITGANYTFTQEDKNAQGVITGYHYVHVSEDGRRPRRLAKFMANFTPSYDLKHATGVPLTIYGQYQYNGSRFSEATDTNVTLYPAYHIINLGAQYQATERLSAQIFVANLTNQLSFTEGDPLFPDLLSPDGTRNRGVARPLFGRTIRASLTYRF
ncbi:TonB-dependent receptor [Pseudoduganella namucuonensis]|uniref:TonB-dependent Receptor Plug Domain n=1 Tax=Pseudoduganella namucuonensis TaxID=1035707 RepID=A0A1I7EV35_9BURK|nr:TonB-dependent receptor [Pseudoduganella namucuonensis]SFU27770.1 TonB-dependent Receptor Plug Domain [Pseudoduganella namucuonensis]